MTPPAVFAHPGDHSTYLDLASQEPEATSVNDDVVAAAVRIADAEGVGALTIRSVAAACRLSPMGLYRHVRDKDD